MVSPTIELSSHFVSHIADHEEVTHLPRVQIFFVNFDSVIDNYERATQSKRVTEQTLQLIYSPREGQHIDNYKTLQ